MSEANNSNHDLTQAESTASTSPAWFADWADFSIPKAEEPNISEGVGETVIGAIAPVDTANAAFDAIDTDAIRSEVIESEVIDTEAASTEEWNDWQTVDFPNAISADAIERQSLDAKPSTVWAPKAAPTTRRASDGVIALPNWGRPQPAQSLGSAAMPEDLKTEPALFEPTPSEATVAPPGMTELMSLIQELNQCNSALIDRVAQLEEALDRSETALQAEITRSQQAMVDSEALSIAHDQIAQLTHQLEFATQAQQRQQILVQTLTTQLENSQERVAQLEQDYQLLQQHNQKQAHSLTQSENACRDLQARLHRQQGYTLQYKAALEKCLEMPPPNYISPESGAAAVFQAPPSAHHLAPQSFLPKAQRIQPWSSQSRSLTGKLGSLVNTSVDSSTQESPIDELGLDELELAELELPPDSSFEIDEVMHSAHTPGVPLRSTNSPTPRSSDEEWVDPILVNPEDEPIDPRLLNAAVQPLTDLSPEAIQVGLTELQSVLDGLLSGTSEAPTEAEIALWQDLARLIDVSSDDLIKATVAQNFESFTEPSSESAQSATEPLAQPQAESIAPSENSLNPLTSEPSTPSQPSVNLAQQHIPPAAVPPAKQWQGLKLPMSAIAAKIAEHASSPQNLTSTPTPVSTPSPLVYPLRPTKKLGSLAAVDLPTFPRGTKNEEGN